MKENLLAPGTWLRGFFMLLYAILFYNVALVVTAALVLFQFGHVLFTGHLNEFLLEFGRSLSHYAHQVFAYLTYNSDRKPFPLSAWPKSKDKLEG